jgi:Tfp pilus assembly protein PilV
MEALLFVIAGCILLGWGPRVLLACIVIPIVLAVLALLTANQRSQHAASPAQAQAQWLEQYCADQKRRSPTFRERYPSSAPQIRCDP